MNEIKVNLLFGTYYILRVFLDDARVLRLTNYSYGELLDLTLRLEAQATVKKRYADFVSMKITPTDLIMLYEVLYSVEVLPSCALTRTFADRDLVLQDLDCSCFLADALIGDECI